MDNDFEATSKLKDLGIVEVKGGVLVGPKELSDLNNVEYDLVKYLFDEWDFIYLSDNKYKHLTNT